MSKTIQLETYNHRQASVFAMLIRAIGELRPNLFLIAIFFTMSLQTGLILPLLLPHPSYISFSLLVLALVVAGTFGRHMYYANTKMAVILSALLFLLVAIDLFATAGVSASIIAKLQHPALLILLIAVLLSAKTEELTKLIRFYIVFCFIMAACGLIAWVLVNWKIVDYQNSLWSLYDATSGRATRDEGIYGYSFPYGLGLVLTGSYQYDVMNFLFYRASGWVHEPTTAAAFIAPALILLARERIFTLPVRRLFFVTLIAFWMACGSVGSLIAFLGLVLFYLFFSRSKYVFWRPALAFASMGFLIWAYTEAQKIFALNPTSKSLLSSKLQGGGDIYLLLNLLSPDTPQEYLHLAVFFLGASVLLFVAARAIRSRNSSAVTFALIPVYLFIHSLKGNWAQVFGSFFTIGFVFMFLRVYVLHWNITNIRPNRQRVFFSIRRHAQA